jgi:hypothetical protein
MCNLMWTFIFKKQKALEMELHLLGLGWVYMYLYCLRCDFEKTSTDLGM